MSFCLVYITGSFPFWEAIGIAIGCFIVVLVLIITLTIIIVRCIVKLIISHIISTLAVIFGRVIDKKGVSYLILMTTVSYLGI